MSSMTVMERSHLFSTRLDIICIVGLTIDRLDTMVSGTS